ncbi:phenazine biosynthesis-like domain-containing protein [Aplysia californica]|uniref:Phenazine biosynthesis-like domain-containing protein n=1 Tax=Aplysia californica TaxID=6500 RepID=A0ABM0JFJ2_APLCA|nr:phenazine biosynthesis-like domain-containing protein [Aplysia californica]
MSAEQKKGFTIYMVDAFTDQVFGGNPAAVCLLSSDQAQQLSDREHQNIAAELNLPVTAFIVSNNGDFTATSKFGLRWFTTTKEIPLCGHGTMAASAVIFNAVGNTNEQIEFSCKSGLLNVACASNDRISMSFPMNPSTPMSQEEVRKLLEVTVGSLDLIQDVEVSEIGMLLVRLKDEVSRETLEKLNPPSELMVSAYSKENFHGLGVTVKGSRDNGCVNKEGQVYDFVSRFFTPWQGVLEDPVCGAWHTVNCGYWSKQLGKTDLYVRQCSSRGGDLWLTVGKDRVTIMGHSVITMKGQFSL